MKNRPPLFRHLLRNCPQTTVGHYDNFSEHIFLYFYQRLIVLFDILVKSLEVSSEETSQKEEVESPSAEHSESEYESATEGTAQETPKTSSETGIVQVFCCPGSGHACVPMIFTSV